MKRTKKLNTSIIERPTRETLKDYRINLHLRDAVIRPEYYKKIREDIWDRMVELFKLMFEEDIRKNPKKSRMARDGFVAYATAYEGIKAWYCMARARRHLFHKKYLKRMRKYMFLYLTMTEREELVDRGLIEHTGAPLNINNNKEEK